MFRNKIRSEVELHHGPPIYHCEPPNLLYFVCGSPGILHMCAPRLRTTGLPDIILSRLGLGKGTKAIKFHDTVTPL